MLGSFGFLVKRVGALTPAARAPPVAHWRALLPRAGAPWPAAVLVQILCFGDVVGLASTRLQERPKKIPAALALGSIVPLGMALVLTSAARGLPGKATRAVTSRSVGPDISRHMAFVPAQATRAVTDRSVGPDISRHMTFVPAQATRAVTDRSVGPDPHLATTWRRVAATPRPRRGCSVETGDAAAATFCSRPGRDPLAPLLATGDAALACFAVSAIATTVIGTLLACSQCLSDVVCDIVGRRAEIQISRNGQDSTRRASRLIRRRSAGAPSRTGGS